MSIKGTGNKIIRIMDADAEAEATEYQQADRAALCVEDRIRILASHQSDFRAMPLALQDVVRVLNRDRLYGAVSHCLERSREVLRKMDDDAAVSLSLTQQKDEWGRDKVIRPTDWAMMFVRDVGDAWDMVRSEVSGDARLPLKKKGLDAVLTKLYANIVLRRGQPAAGDMSVLLTHMFYSRAALALQHYCFLRKWVYGRDLIITCNGSSLDPMPRWTREPSKGVWSEQVFEVVSRDASDKTMREVRMLVLHALYGVEDDMRAGGTSSPWRFPEESLDTILDALRTVADICRVRQPTSDSPLVHGDTCTWMLREGKIEGTVLKTSDALVMPKPHSQATEVKGQGRRLLRTDMAPHISLSSISHGRPIRVFGDPATLFRDFTYVDDIISGIRAVLDRRPSTSNKSEIYNLGSGR